MRHSHSNYVRNLSTAFRSCSATTNPQSRSSSFLSGLDDDSALSSLKLKRSSASADSSTAVFKRISSILYGGRSAKNKPDSEKIDNARESEREPKISWMSNISSNNILMQRKGHSRAKKQKCLFELSQDNRFGKLIEICARVLGTEATIELFCRVGRQPGLKGYNTLIETCIDKARETNEDLAIEEMGKVFHLFESMCTQGLQLEEQTYRSLLLYIIDMHLVEEFHFFCDVIKEKNPSSIARLGYYEMMLWLRVNNEEKIQDLCYYIAENDGDETSDLRVNYLFALCESDRKEEILKVLEIIDIKKIPSAESVAKIFQALGRLLLEPVAEKFLLDFKTSDHEANNITNFIASYAVSIPSLTVEDVITKFKDLHQRLEVSPSSSSYEKLILHSCALLKVHVALDVVDEMCEAGLDLSNDVLNFILKTCEETSEYNLVHRVFSIIRHYNLDSNDETFRCMIDMFLKMKDFEGAYGMLDDLEDLNLKPNVSMYNTIMAECFHEKNISDGVRVLEHMQCANVKPNSQTFSFLISNSETVEDIARYYEELKQSGIKATKQIFMALINAYAGCGQLEKAKQVVLDPLIPARSLHQIKRVLVPILVAHGQLSEALRIHEEIKQAGYKLEPKDVMSLIERIQSAGELDTLLLLLEELNDTDFWNEACCRIILYCIRNNHISSAVDLCKLLKDKFQSDELVMEVLFDKVFSVIEESESNHLHTSLELLSEIKNKLGLLHPKKCHDPSD